MSRSSHSLSKIAITVIGPKASTKLHWQRRAMQWGMVAIAVLIPLSGLFRIDPVVGAFIILDRQVWWSDFFLIFGFWITLASSLVMVYSLVGTAFCGWACPQNTLSEWANLLTHKLLGRRAEVSLDGAKMHVATAKNKWTHWLLLGLILFGTAALFALIPMFYFYTPDAMWSFVTLREDARLAGSLHYIYFIFLLLILVDIAFIRHFWCRFMCVYKVWQHGFKTKQTLHIAYDAARAADCVKCNYCVTACFIDLDPRKTDIYDTCINCGECVTACNVLHAKQGEPGLLSFAVGERRTSNNLAAVVSNALGSLNMRMRWTLPFALLGISMFAWGLGSYSAYHLAVYRADIMQGAQISDYRVAVSNKLYKPASFTVRVEGLPAGSYALSDAHASLSSAGRADINLHIDRGLAPGLHSFLVHVATDSGWEKNYRVQHFVGRGF